ncbi:MAG: hypothetical protein Q9227_001356 [Pyrenula ochraceoflavens]
MILETGASVLTVAEVALKLYHHLSKFIEGARRAQDVPRKLQDKCRLFRETLRLVEQTYKESERRWTSKELYSLEGSIWENVRVSLRHCQGTLRIFQKDLRSVINTSSDNHNLGWAAKGKLQLKIDAKREIIERFERDIDSDMHTLELSMLCINTRNTSSLAQSASALSAALGVSKAFLNGMPSSSPPRYTLSEQDQKISLSRVQRSIDIGNAVLAEKGLPIYAEPQAIQELDHNGQFEGIRDLKQANRSDVQSENSYSNRGDENKDVDEAEEETEDEIEITAPERAKSNSYDPEPSFDDRLPSTLLQAIRKSYCNSIRSFSDSNRFNLAEAQQRELSTLLANNPEMSSEWHKSQQTLAHLCKQQGRTEDARMILFALARRPSEADSAPSKNPSDNLLQPYWTEENMLQCSNVYYQLANIETLGSNGDVDHHIKYDREKFAKRAVKLRWRMHSKYDTSGFQKDKDLLNSLQLLSELWTRDEKRPAAEVLKTICHVMPISHATSLDELALSLSGFEQKYRGIDDPRPECADTTQAGMWSKIDDFKPDGHTKLTSAIQNGDENKVWRIVWQKKADVNKRSQEGKSPLLYAIEGNNETIIENLCKAGATINAMDDDMTPLRHAITLGNTAMVELLLKLGAEPDLHTPSQSTPLFHTIEHVSANSPDIVRALLRSKADPLATHSDEMKTPLHRAVDKNLLKIAKAIIETSEEPVLEAKDSRDRAPFEWAVSQDRYDFVEVFLESGVPVTQAMVDRAPKGDTRDLLKSYHRRKSSMKVVHENDSVSSRTPSDLSQSTDISQISPRKLSSSKFSFRRFSFSPKTPTTQHIEND